jgi:Cu(I)/Ag(I) efflux system protein CusF
MKYAVRFLAVLASLSFVSVSIHAQAHDGHLPQSDGVIKKIDAAGGKVSIAHGEIANLKMPPMTMTFKAKSPEVLKGWTEGDKVRFRAAEVKGDLTVVSIEAAK